MEKPFQLEFFKSQKYQSDTLKKGKYRPNFFGFIRLYEKAILLVIVIFIISLVSFSAGLEKGKRLKLQAQPKNEQIIITSPLPGLEKKLKNKEDIAEFTIQVATFKTQAYAQKEAKRLEKKGLSALIIPRGKYVCVSVGRFSRKKEASLTLSQLRKTYHDCYIRRL